MQTLSMLQPALRLVSQPPLLSRNLLLRPQWLPTSSVVGARMCQHQAQQRKAEEIRIPVPWGHIAGENKSGILDLGLP